MKATVHYIEKNRRLEMRERHTRTLEITDMWDVDKACEEIKDKISSNVQRDSTIEIISYRVGRRTFQIK